MLRVRLRLGAIGTIEIGACVKGMLVARQNRK